MIKTKKELIICGAKEYINNNFENDIKCDSSAKLKTGFKNMDKTGDLYPGLYVLGAVSSIGKTTFVNQLADQIAMQNTPVLFFTLEQTKLELITKSITRTMVLQDTNTALTSAEIRTCSDFSILEKARKHYNTYSEYISIVEGNFNTTMEEIKNCIDEYMNREFEKRPVIIIDYLQIIKSKYIQNTNKVVEHNIQELKQIQEQYQCVVIVVSAINRQNYIYTIDFSAFKNSGSIEYTADVVWGMQMHILSEAYYDRLRSINQKREYIEKAISTTPREIQICLLKNRWGRKGINFEFEYFPAYDYFAVNKNYTQRARACEKKRV